MSNSIKIDNPEEVISHIKRINAILVLFQEDSRKEQKGITAFEELISEARQIVSFRKNQLQIALEQSRKEENDNEDASDNSRGLRAKVDKCDEQLQKINHCQSKYISLCQDQSMIVRKSEELVDVSKTLASKLETLILKIKGMK